MSLPPIDVTRRSVHVKTGDGEDDTIAIEGVMREPDVVSWFVPLIDEVHRAATEHKVKEIVLDIRRLEYANAAVWKCFVYWVRLLREDRQACYRLRILSNPAHRWQEVGMPMLRVFGADRLTLEDSTAGPRT